MDIKDELITLASALTVASQKGAIDAFCLIASGDDQKDEAAYWAAIRVGAQHCGFWVVGNSPKIKVIDKEWQKVTLWVDDIGSIPPGNIVLIGQKNLVLQ